MNTRTLIARHLALSDKLEIARKEVEERDLPEEYVAEKYGLEYKILYRKIDIIRRKKKFYNEKPRFDAATKKVFEGKFTCHTAAIKYGFPVPTLYYQLRKACAQEDYEYDKKIKTLCKEFTYLQEELLLEHLKNWKRRESSQSCTCQLCALEQLLTLAYEFAQQNNIKCSSSWNTFKQASINWLEDFEMRHSDEISRSFDSLEKCLKQIQADE